ncbi:DUF1918 domain-containing protein [Kitasatospora sp. NPDC028055]|uniref:DUF1918 domain-containing protein n=1 Tax=Kitasatospora sp. NPDC028055 TaxID=3155653 RepID=UPI0033D8DBD8
MKANVGDTILLPSRIPGQTDNSAEIIEVRGEDGAPPYLVRYPNGHTALVMPGPDAVIAS